jgi:hypothetical protein
MKFHKYKYAKLRTQIQLATKTILILPLLVTINKIFKLSHQILDSICFKAPNQAIIQKLINSSQEYR